MSDGQNFNIAAYLPRMAAQQPDTPAVHFPLPGHGPDKPYLTISYQELNQRSDQIALGLERLGIKEGVRTALMVKPCPDFFALTFALFKVGAVPVLIDPGMGVKNLKTCLGEAQPQAFIGIPQAHIARLILGWGKESIKILLTVGKRWFWGGQTLTDLLACEDSSQSYVMATSQADSIAAILFTSGSTGVPKGAVYTHGNFLAQVEALKDVYDIRPGEIDLPTFPLFALFAPALGMTSVIPEMDFTRPGQVDPEKIIAAIQRFNATTMFGSPALIRRVGAYGQGQSVKLPSLKRVISAGAPVPANVLESFSSMLGDDVQIFTPYGATESLPVCSVGSHTILSETRFLTDQGQGVCIGHPVASIELKIIKISDDPIPTWSDDLEIEDGEIGEIVVRGPQVTNSYFNRDHSTELAKITDNQGRFYHRMGDVGYRDNQGRIWFCGRKAHRVDTPGERLFTIPCEALFNTHKDIFRTALVGVQKDGATLPVVCVELLPQSVKIDRNKLMGELHALAQSNRLTQTITTFLVHKSFPVDIRHNAKIFREKLAIWAQEQLS